MGSIGTRWAGALLAAMWLGCGGDAGEAPRAEVAVGDPQQDLDVDVDLTTSSDWLEDEVAEEGAPVLVSVRLRPDPPVPGQAVQAVARVEDGGRGSTLSYVWTVAGRQIEDETGGIELPALRKGQRVEVAVTAHNAAGVSETLSAEAEIENRAPTVLDLQVQEKYDGKGELEGWEARAWARDPDGDDVDLEYTWFLNDRPTELEGTVFATDELKRGDRVWVRVLASDGDDESEIAESGVLEVGNSAPEIVSTPPLLDASGRFTYQIEVNDADGDRNFRYELVEGPPGMRIDAFRGKLTWAPEESQAGKHRVEVAVTDRSRGRSSQSFLIPVVVREVRSDSDSDSPPANAR